MKRGSTCQPVFFAEPDFRKSGNRFEKTEQISRQKPFVNLQGDWHPPKHALAEGSDTRSWLDTHKQLEFEGRSVNMCTHVAGNKLTSKGITSAEETQDKSSKGMKANRSFTNIRIEVAPISAASCRV
jgi:hypothetical protein